MTMQKQELKKESNLIQSRTIYGFIDFAKHIDYVEEVWKTSPFNNMRVSKKAIKNGFIGKLEIENGKKTKKNG